MAQYTGGSKDGHSSTLWMNPASIYSGGEMDGYSGSHWTNPAGIYVGGQKDGHSSTLWMNPASIYSGGSKDGHSSTLWMNPASIYSGGEMDGYSGAHWTNPAGIYVGGQKDGHSSRTYVNSISIYSGGSDDGYVAGEYTNSISIFSGGSADGYDKGSKILIYIWTGAIGTGWNIEDNWLDGIIPNINSNVVIPSSAVNFPFINAGIMSIGEDLNSGLYFCKQIIIRHGAEMTMRQLAFLENYGTIEIRGVVYVLNNAEHAIINGNSGHLHISSKGRLIFQ